jgi:histidinol-phosphate aminotransferase
MEITNLIRKNILELIPYSAAREEYSSSEGIFLDANENAFGSTVNQLLNRYPDPLHQKLKSKIADIKGVKPEQIFIGNGSDEAIDLIIRAFCEPVHESIMIFPPTYGMYEVCAAVNNVPVKQIPLTPNFQIDLEVVLKHINKKIKTIFICSPNNPTGNCLSADHIQVLLANVSGLIVLDEAYIDFSPEKSWLAKLNQYKNLIILQTFSKAWGLANIRLGMAFADPEIIQILNNIKYPYNVNGLTQQIALDALQNIMVKNQMVSKILEQKEYLKLKLTKLPIVEEIFPSDANFLLVKVKNVLEVFLYLLSKKIVVRNRSNVALCQGCLRVTVGTEYENKKLVEALVNFNH